MASELELAAVALDIKLGDDLTWPQGSRILGSGIDGVTGNRYVAVLLQNQLVASIISGPRSYGGTEGLWELAPCWYAGGTDYSVMQLDEMNAVTEGWHDVRGWLDTPGVGQLLWELSEIPVERVVILRDAFMRLRSLPI